MTTIFVILIILASVVLGLIVLIQNPKGGGLAGNIAGFSSQFMGVKQTTDVLEKGIWLFAAIIGVLCLLSSLFISAGSGGTDPIFNKSTGTSTTPTQQQPNNGAQFPTQQQPAQTPPDSGK
ncbi:MAG TPA: preprotein translocase subunit SecG [Chitinophagaceae bacterium]